MKIIEYDSLKDCEKEIRIFQDKYSTNVFFDYDWMSLWKENFGKKYREKIMLFVENGELKGFVPLVFTETKGMKRTYRLFGGNMNGYNSISAIKGYEHLIYINLFDYLKKDKKAGSIRIEDIKNTSIDFKILKELCRVEKGIQQFQYSCPYTSLDSDWETFFKSHLKRSKKRSELKAFRKKLAYLGEVSFIDINDNVSWEKYHHLIEQTFKIHHLRFQEVMNTSKYSVSKYKNFYINVIEKLAKRKKLDLSLICLDGIVISFIFAFRDKKILIDYIPGINPSLAKLSLGHIHLMELFQNIIKENEIEIFDFSKGLGTYKEKWSDSSYDNYIFSFRLINSISSNLIWLLNIIKTTLILFGRKKGWNNRLKLIIGKLNSRIISRKSESKVKIIEHQIKIAKDEYAISDYSYAEILALDMLTQRFIIEQICSSKQIALWRKNNRLEFIQVFDKSDVRLYRRS